MEDKLKWLIDARIFLDEEYTQHLHKRSLETDDVDTIVHYIKKAKGIWASLVSESDQLINQSKNI